MSFTYVAANSGSTNSDYLSAVRFIIQDTDSATAEITDEEITAQYGTTSSDDEQEVRNYGAAYLVAVALERRYRKQATCSSGGTSVNYAQRAEAWALMVGEIATELFRAKMRAAQQTEGAIIGGRPPLYYDGFAGVLY